MSNVRQPGAGRPVVALAVLVLLAAGCGSGPRPSGAATTATPPASVAPTIAATPTGAPTPTPTVAPALVPMVPVTGFWSDRGSISRADLASAVAGAAWTGAGDGPLLVSEVDLAPLAATLGVSPNGAVRALPAADITAALATTPGAIGVIRAADVGPGVHALEVDGLGLFGEHRIADLADWPLLVPEAPGSASTFDAAALWTLAAGGDVMLDRWPYRRAVIDGLGADYPWAGGTAVVTSRYCCGWPGLKLAAGRSTGQAGAFASLFRDADVGLVNLEGPAPDAFSYHQGTLLFTMDPALLPGIARAGIDVVSLANNHIFNAGATGVADTIRNLDAAGIGHMGAGADAAAARAPAWVTAGGLRIAILGYNGIDTSFDATATKAGAALLSESAMVADVKAARAAGADVVLIVPHWGVEYTDVVSAAQRRLARAVVAAGADAILGSHSHWAGPLEIVDGHLVVYSFGDLLFDLGHDERTQEAMVAELTFAGRRLVQVDLHPTLILDRSQPNLLEPAGGGSALMAAIAAGSARLAP